MDLIAIADFSAGKEQSHSILILSQAPQLPHLHTPLKTDLDSVLVAPCGLHGICTLQQMSHRVVVDSCINCQVFQIDTSSKQWQCMD